MTMAPDPNEDALFSSLEAEMVSIDTSDVVDFTKIDTQELLSLFASVERSLRELEEMHHPHTSLGRELHSKRYACQLEMRRRKLR